MPQAFTLEQAQAKLVEWTTAETALATGAQSYSIAGRALTKANLREVGERVKFYTDLTNELLARPTPGARVRRVVPFD
jgi:uncharacterized Zn finger protein